MGAGKSSNNDDGLNLRVNDRIRAQEVRLLGEDGHQYGVVSIHQAKLISQDKGVDLIEISPNANPPVVKLMDYGKYKYQLQKKASEAKKKQVVVSVKELKLRPSIEAHDLEVKLKKVKEFLEEGDKVKIMMQFRGREMAHLDLGKQRFSEILKMIEALGAVVEADSRVMGNKIHAVATPDKKK